MRVQYLRVRTFFESLKNFRKLKKMLEGLKFKKSHLNF